MRRFLHRLLLLPVAVVLTVSVACQAFELAEESRPTGVESEPPRIESQASDPVVSDTETDFVTPETEISEAEISLLPPEDISALNGYRIIVSETASNSLIEAVSRFSAALTQATGVLFPTEKSASSERTEREIVIGNTDLRDEFSDVPLTDGSFFLLMRCGEKIMAAGKGDAETELALRYLTTVFLTPGNPDRQAVAESGRLFGLADGESMTGDAFSRFQITLEEIDAYISSHDRIDVTACRVDRTGTVDATELMQYLHASGKPIYYPNGKYLFNGETLCFAGGVIFESPHGVIIHNAISENPIVNFDSFGNLIGLQQNHLEYKTGGENSKHGSLVPPPLSTARYEIDIDFLPIFYNDFGLLKSLNQSWHGWFYWLWNHQDNVTPGYDPQRHPLLGWYYGDDPVVLDWICYWLRQYGINQMILLSTPLKETWKNPMDPGYWHYQLFNHVKNFNEMKYVLEVDHMNQDPDIMLNHWKEVIRRYRDYPHYYTRSIDGKTLAVVYNWQDNVMSDKLGGDRAYADFMVEVSRYAKELLGVDGVLIMGRAMNDFPEELTNELKKEGVYRYHAGYEPNCIENPETLKTYEQYVSRFNGDLASRNTILAVSTGMLSHTHPSGWTISGSSPELFEQWLTKAVVYLREKKPLLPIVTIYNISEWGEGGPGLQPNVQDGFGYLQAVADALGISLGQDE